MKKIDELKAEIEKAENELKYKKEQLRIAELTEEAKKFQIGDYIEATSEGERLVGRLVEISGGCGYIRYSIKTLPYGTILIGSPIKKWQPKKGDLCIFWDNEKRNSFIDVFKKQDGSLYLDRENCRFFNCIPFISEQQFKEHIGYEEC